MKKTQLNRVVKGFGMLIISTMLFTVPVMASSEIKVICDGKEIQFDQPPINQNGRVMLPIRYVAESLGWDVGYEDGVAELSYVVEDGNKRYFTFIDIGNAEIRNFISVNQVEQINETKSMDPSPNILNGRTLVGVRQLAEALYAQVDWDDNTKTVVITSKSLPYTNDVVDVQPTEDNKTNIPTPAEKTAEEVEADKKQQQEEWEQEVIKLVNEERTNAGLSEVTINDELMELGRERAEEMYEYKVRGHMSPVYLLEHTELAQYLGIDCVYAGENSFALHGEVINPEYVMGMWMYSEGHKAHILNSKVQEIGVGYSNGCWSLWLMY